MSRLMVIAMLFLSSMSFGSGSGGTVIENVAEFAPFPPFDLSACDQTKCPTPEDPEEEKDTTTSD